MKELDDFTVERLEKLIHLDGSGCVVYDAGVVGALARIALAAKTAEPLRVEIQMDDAYLKKHLKELTRWRSPTEMMSMPEIEANSPELPDGWILLAEQKPEVGDEVIIGASDGSLDVATWCGDHFDDGDFFNHITWPTHWKPRPTPPTTEK
ncbi:DUF551 domain-containing protein [Serratia fonticola]